MSLRNVCPACSHTVSNEAFEKDCYKIRCCKKCSTLFVHNVPTAEELALIYASNTYYELPDESVKRIELENIRRVRHIKKYCAEGDFLDIGCARGGLLDIAKASGFKTYGVEPTPANAAVALGKDHIIFNGWLSDFVRNNSRKQFDVITCLDVIEHIEHSLEFLKMAVSLLANNGILILSTPNYSGIVAKKLKANDPYMTPPEHLNFFTAGGLRELAGRCNLYEIEYTNFGSLTAAETGRSINRYLPWLGKLFHPFVQSCVNFSFSLANRFGVGLEQEIYLRKLK